MTASGALIGLTYLVNHTLKNQVGASAKGQITVEIDKGQARYFETTAANVRDH